MGKEREGEKKKYIKEKNGQNSKGKINFTPVADEEEMQQVTLHS